MTWYKRSDYGVDPHAGASRNNASQRGWGSGWPNCQSSKMTAVIGGGVKVSVRREVATLVKTLMDNTERLGYAVLTGQTWGFACRAIRGTSTPSNHSWGLAVDINSLSNPMQSTFQSNIPPAVVRMWEACGFYWGGRYQNRPDAMHFEYIFRPTDVAGHLRRAQGWLAEPDDEQEADMTKEEHAKLMATNAAVAELQLQVRSIAQGVYDGFKALSDGKVDLTELADISRSVSGKKN